MKSSRKIPCKITFGDIEIKAVVESTQISYCRNLKHSYGSLSKEWRLDLSIAEWDEKALQEFIERESLTD